MNPAACVILVPLPGPIAPQCEQSLLALEQRGYAVQRMGGFSSIDLARSTLTCDALAAGFNDLMWINPDISFDPDGVEKLRRHNHPLVCGLYPSEKPRELACAFLPGTEKVVFGPSGGLLEIRYAAFGFLLTRRVVYEAIRRQWPLPECNQRFGKAVAPWFLPLLAEDAAAAARDLKEDFAFCERARRCQFRILADTTVRLYRIGSYAFGWEDAGGDKQTHSNYLFRLPASTPSGDAAAAPPAVGLPTTADSPARRNLSRNPLHAPAKPLPSDFPRIKAYVVSYAANHDSLEKTLKSFRESDWGEDPLLQIQPADWPIGPASGAKNYKRILETALSDGCDYALILEDDVRVNRRLRRNLLAIPLLQRDQCDYLSLFMPDLIASPWQRHEAHLGYRLARPLYSGPNQQWEKHRLWGAQAYVLSRRLLQAALERWDRLIAGQDTRIIAVCAELHLPMWYSAPCLVQHAPLRSSCRTPTSFAPDFSSDFVREEESGFQPPEEVPGELTVAEGKLLWQVAADRRILELATMAGRATVCLGQQARRVVSVDAFDQAEAREWVRRYGLADRVEFMHAVVDDSCRNLRERFDVVFVDAGRDAPTLNRDIEATLPLLNAGGRFAFHDYPDPSWPEVRPVVDAWAERLGWTRLAQVDYLGVFQCRE